ncbi:hypothetical protein A2U01_0106082, partial [Trifolium medium]|nr:hypothetical protein [Trifolium medium]
SESQDDDEGDSQPSFIEATELLSASELRG